MTSKSRRRRLRVRVTSDKTVSSDELKVGEDVDVLVGDHQGSRIRPYFQIRTLARFLDI